MATPARPYEQQVRDGPIPHVHDERQVTPQDYGTEVVNSAARAIGSFADASADAQLAAHEYESAKQRSAGALDAYSKLSNTDLQLREFVGSQRGKDAMAGSDQALKNFEANVDTIRNDIKDPAVRSTYDRMASERREQFTRYVNEHVTTQNDIAQRESLKGALASSSNDASSAAANVAQYEAQAQSATNDFDRRTYADFSAINRRAMERAIEIGRAAVRSDAARNGVDPAEALLDHTSRAHVAVVDSFLTANNPREAARYLEERREEIRPEIYSKASGVVAEANASAQAVKIEGALVNSVGGDPSRFVAEAEKLDGPMRERVLDLHDARMRRDEKARIATDAPMIAELKVGYMNGGLRPHGQLYGKLSVQGKATIDEWWRAQQRKARGGSSAKEQDRLDRTIISRYLALDVTNNAGKDQVSVPIVGNPMFDGASEEAVNKITRYQKNAIRSVQNGTGVALGDYRKMVDLQALGAGYKRNTPMFNGFKEYMNDAWNDWREDPSNDELKRPPVEAVKKWIEDATATMIKEHWYGDEKKPAWNVERSGLEGFAPAGKPVVPRGATADPSSSAGAERRTEPPPGWLRLIDKSGTKLMAWDPAKPLPEGWVALP